MYISEISNNFWVIYVESLYIEWFKLEAFLFDLYPWMIKDLRKTLPYHVSNRIICDFQLVIDHFLQFFFNLSKMRIFQKFLENCVILHCLTLIIHFWMIDLFIKIYPNQLFSKLIPSISMYIINKMLNNLLNFASGIACKNAFNSKIFPHNFQ